MMTTKKKQLRRFVEDALEGVLDEFDKETAQRIIEGGDKLPQILKLALTRLGTPPDDIRLTQAKRLWDLGYGRELGYESFEAYLETIPSIPASLLVDDPKLPLLTLDDPRVRRTVRARLVGVRHEEWYNDESFVPFDARHETPQGPYWFRAHNGHPNRGRKPSDCRNELTGNLLAGTADVLLALFTQHQNVVKKRGHVMDGPGSVNRVLRGNCSYLRVWNDGAELSDRWSDVASSNYGSVIFRRE